MKLFIINIVYDFYDFSDADELIAEFLKNVKVRLSLLVM